MRAKIATPLFALSLLALLPSAGVLACTGIMLKTADGSFVHGRTAEFAVPLDISIAVIPRGTSFTGTTPDGAGLSYRAKYAAVGASAFHEQALLDGMNEEGLAAAAFYFPTFASYAPTTAATRAKSVAPSEFPNWLITQFATVKDVIAAVEGGEIAIAPTIKEKWGPEPGPFHYIVYDKSGAALVIEPVDGKLQLHASPMGTITNSPSYDWHMINLRNYIGLRRENVPAVTVDQMHLKPLGQGSGMIGLPGDFTPPSRFVRAAVFSAAAPTPADGASGVKEVLHILNNFDIPKGAAVEREGDTIASDYTQMTGARDPKALRYYWKTYDDQTIRMVDLKDAIARIPAGTPASMIFLDINSAQPIVDMTGTLPVK